jgi:hypothetical protein
MKHSKKYPVLLGLECRPKGDWRGWHVVVPAFFFLWGLVNKKAKSDFYERYFTTLSDVLYIPKHKYEDFLDRPDQALLRHEAVHLMDNNEHPIWFKLSYIFSAKHRLHWEVRGYAQDMIYDMERFEYVPLYTRLRITNQFSPGSIYRLGLTLHQARELVDTLAKKIENKEFVGNYPDIDQDWNK